VIESGKRLPTKQEFELLATGLELTVGRLAEILRQSCGTRAVASGRSADLPAPHDLTVNSLEEKVRVRSVDPRNIAWEVDDPAYRVYFWSHPPGPPPSGEGRRPGFRRIRGDDADVTVVLEWAESKASPGQTFTLYALVQCNGTPGLIRRAASSPWRMFDPIPVSGQARLSLLRECPLMRLTRGLPGTTNCCCGGGFWGCPALTDRADGSVRLPA
jgi:hypothetical protein